MVLEEGKETAGGIEEETAENSGNEEVRGIWVPKPAPPFVSQSIVSLYF